MIPSERGALVRGCWSDMIREPLAFHRRLAREKGDVCRFRALLWWVHCVHHPDGVQRVLQDGHRNYNKDTADYQLLKSAAGEGLLTSDGEFWRKQRRTIQPIFHRKNLDDFGPMIGEQAAQLAEGWEEYGQSGEHFDVDAELVGLTLQVVGQALFRMDLSRDARVIGDSFSEVTQHLGAFDLWTFLPAWAPTPRTYRYRKALKLLDQTIHKMIERRRQEIAACEDEAGLPQDLLTLLLTARDPETGEPMDDKQVRDEAITLLVAGHETMSNALSWTFYLLDQNPEAEARLHAELDRVLNGRRPLREDLPELPYATMVLEESMRLYPPAWIMSRKAQQADVIGGHEIPNQGIVLVLPYVTHRHPEFWPDPEAFVPERFTPERKKERHRFAYFPFGGGPRLCIGKHFAMMEAPLILATLAQRFKLRLKPGFPVVPQPLITLRLKHGLQMSAIPRARK